uniref:MSP domain-containing protein n=1 Tax=Kalanchoe fedtschenkoi TaxID=63787 RepID=A0A7N0RDV6_KALFE
MAIEQARSQRKPESKLWKLCPFWQSGAPPQSSSSSSSAAQSFNQSGSRFGDGGVHSSQSVNQQAAQPSSVLGVARSLLPARRRLRLDPASSLYFPYEPGKQVRSAVRIKNTSKSHVAFKFQTTAPKSCYMRPPGGILAPGETIIATVFKFVEPPDNNNNNNNEKQSDQKSNVKFKILSLKVTPEGVDYAPELFDEQKEHVTIERILRVVFLDPERPTPALEKLNRQLAEAEAAVETRKKPPAETGPKVIGEGLVIDEWKERREKYLARQQVEAVDSV